ncbi:MAG: hypothetical protein OXL33_01325 [Chloroflexota bacterium]|nr:hypothetical protein [Chloroflexota bacterium]
MPATLAPDRLLRPTMVVAAYPYAAEVAVGGLLLALAEASVAATIVVLAPRILAGPDQPDDSSERAFVGLTESAAAFGAGSEVLDFSQQTIRDDPVAAAQLGQILRRRRPGNLITHPGRSPNPDCSAAFAIAWRAAVLARSGGGLIAGAPLEEALQIWSFGDAEPGLPRVRFPTGEFAERKYGLLGQLESEIGDPLPDPEQLARDRDLNDDGPAEELFLVGQPW